jgi:hypothetical protein
MALHVSRPGSNSSARPQVSCFSWASGTGSRREVPGFGSIGCSSSWTSSSGSFYHPGRPLLRKRSARRSGARSNSWPTGCEIPHYFERVLGRNRSRGPWLVGARLTYADLSLAQVVAGCFCISQRDAQRPQAAAIEEAPRRGVRSSHASSYVNRGADCRSIDDIWRYPELGG